MDMLLVCVHLSVKCNDGAPFTFRLSFGKSRKYPLFPPPTDDQMLLKNGKRWKAKLQGPQSPTELPNIQAIFIYFGMLLFTHEHGQYGGFDS